MLADQQRPQLAARHSAAEPECGTTRPVPPPRGLGGVEVVVHGTPAGSVAGAVLGQARVVVDEACTWLAVACSVETRATIRLPPEAVHSSVRKGVVVRRR